MHSKKVLLFDLDGTLLPIDNNDFEHTYFKGLCKAFSEFAPEDLIKYIWAGTKAMILNDGSKTNRQAFAEEFSKITGLNYYDIESRFENYYMTNFSIVKSVCKITDLSKNIVNSAKQKGYTVAIATNPIFPKIATSQRLCWLGLNYDDFPLVTTFENSNFAKPNTNYYLDICKKLNVSPNECIMIGNDTSDDGSAKACGMEVILINDYLINKKNQSLEDYKVMSLEELKEYIDNLPKIN